MEPFTGPQIVLTPIYWSVLALYDLIQADLKQAKLSALFSWSLIICFLDNGPKNHVLLSHNWYSAGFQHVKPNRGPHTSARASVKTSSAVCLSKLEDLDLLISYGHA